MTAVTKKMTFRAFLIISLNLALTGSGLFMLWVLHHSGELVDLILSNPAAILGVPFIGGASFIVVLSLRYTVGDIEFKAFGVEFKGASGPIVLWCFAYLSMTAGAVALWESGEGYPIEREIGERSSEVHSTDPEEINDLNP